MLFGAAFAEAMDPEASVPGERWRCIGGRCSSRRGARLPAHGVPRSYPGSEFLYEVRIPPGQRDRKGWRELPLESGSAFGPSAAELRR